MCLKDGDLITGAIRFEAVTTTARQVIPDSSSRVGLTVFPPATGNVTLSPLSDVVAQAGITLIAGGPPLELSYGLHGALVQRGFFGIASAGTLNIGIVESRFK